MKNSIQRGFSLLELLLVLVIAVTFIIMSTRYYYSYKKTRDIGLFQTSVSELMGALNQYYFMHCGEAGYVFPHTNLIPQLQTDGLISRKSYHTHWAIFSAEIENVSQTEKKFYVLRVTASIINPNNTSSQNLELAAYLRGALNADVILEDRGLEVIWTRLPLNTRDDLSSHQWIMNQRPGQQFMPGRFMTGVNTGTGSKFWILNGSLQSFANDKGNENGNDYAANCPN